MKSKICTIFVAIFVLLLPFALYSQESSEFQSNSETETQFDWGDEGGESSTLPSVSTSSSIWLFLKMVIALVVVALCIYAIFIFLRKNANGIAQSNDPFLRQVAHLSLGPGKSVRVVSLVDKAYILGITDNSVNLIAEVGNRELVDSMNLYADKHDKTSKPRSFADVLDMFMPSSSKNTSVFSSSAESAASSLQKQRERFGERDGRRE